MNALKSPVALLALAAVAAAGAFVVFRKKSGSGLMYDAGSAAAGAAYDLVDGVVSTAVLTTGDAIGLPRTNQTQCEKDKAAGRTWDASFSCPAKDFLSYVFS